METKNEIIDYIHCDKCNNENKEDSPQDFSQYDIGFTEKGIQAWCRRHDCNIIHIEYVNDGM